MARNILSQETGKEYIISTIQAAPRLKHFNNETMPAAPGFGRMQKAGFNLGFN